MGHLDDAGIARLVAGQCSPEEGARIGEHLAGCPECAAWVRRYDDPNAVTREAPLGKDEVRARFDAARHGEGNVALPRGAPVGRYFVLRPVGQGGMGVVYAAYDPELDRRVAIKLLRASPGEEGSSGDAQARFLLEAKAMARVPHPNVTAVYDVGTFGNQIFVAMDLVEGANLRAWLREQQRPWREVLDVVRAAGRGLAAAHAAGVVHRDFKPENVLVGRDGRVQVTDFGLARLVDSELVTTPDVAGSRTDLAHRLGAIVTQDGVVIGTPPYMAPELHQGKPPDARSDQFSFCVTLYFALYGKRPFDPQRMSEAMAPLAAGGHTQPLTAPGTEPLILPPPREPRVPGWVRKALMRGLSLRPEDRFPSMGALLAQLSGPPAAARSVWVSAGVLLLVAAGVLGYRGALHRQAALCGGAEARLERVWDATTEKEVATAFSVTGAPYAGTTFASVKSRLDGYAQGWTRMHTDTCRATRVTGEQTEAVLSLRMLCLDRRLKALESATELLRKSDVKVLDRAVDVVNALPRVEECADVEALSMPVPPPGDEKSRVAMALVATQVARAETLRSAGQYERAAELATQAVEEARGLGHAPLLADALVQQGFAHLMDTDGPSAERALLEAWRVAEAGRHDEARVRAAWGLTYVQGELLGNLAQARSWADLGLAVLPRVGKRPDLEIRLRESLGVLLYRQGRFQEGAEELERVLAFSDQTVGLEHPSRVALLNNLSLCYGELGQSAKMIQALEASVALGERLHGPRHPSLVSVHNNLADSYLEVMDLDRAEAHVEQALGTLEATVGPDHPKVGFVLNTKASLLLYRKRYAESLALNQRALGLMERMTGARHQILAHPLGGMGEALVALGRPREALPYLERALGLDNPQPASRARADFQLARALMLLKLEGERARSLAVQARELYLGIGKKTEAAEVEAWLGAQPR